MFIFLLFTQVINKQNDSPFTSYDEKVFSAYLQFCGIGLRNAQLYERSQLEVKRNQVFLQANFTTKTIDNALEDGQLCGSFGGFLRIFFFRFYWTWRGWCLKSRAR